MAELLQYSLRAGVDESADPKQSPPGTLSVAENVYQDKTGRVVTRPGTVSRGRSIVGGGAISAGKRLVPLGDQIAIVDGTHVYVWDAGVSAWKLVDRVPNLRVRQRPLADSARTVASVDVFTYDDVLYSVYEAGLSASGSPIYLQADDVATDGKVLPPTLLAGSAKWPRIVQSAATPDLVHVLYVVGTELRARTFDKSTRTVGSESAIRTGLVSATEFDAVATDSFIYATYELSAGTNRLEIARINPATLAVPASAQVDGSTGGYRALCIDATANEYVHVAFCRGTTTRLVTMLESTLGSTVGPTEIEAQASGYVFVARDDGNHVLFGWALTSLTVQQFSTVRVASSLHTQATTTLRRTKHMTSPSKPWRDGSRWYCAATSLASSSGGGPQSPSWASRVIVEILLDEYAATPPPHRHVATLENQTGWYEQGPAGLTALPLSGYLTQPTANVVGRGRFVAALTRTREPTERLDNVPCGANVWCVMNDDGDKWRPVVVGRNVLLASAAPAVLDGATAMPAGYMHPPVISAFAVGGSGSGSMAAGTYVYSAVYEWKDASGVLHRSPPATPTTVPLVQANGSVVLTILTASICAKQSETTGLTSTSASPVSIAIYRTVVGGNGALYRLTYEPQDNVRLNDPTSGGTVAFGDTRADANIKSTTPAIPLNTREQLYVESGELEDIPPPAFETATVHRGRIAGIGPDLRTVHFSKTSQEDATVFPGFNEALTLAFDEDKHALGSLHDRLAVFGATGIDIVDGDGPDAAGTQNTWRIIRVQSDTGCTNPRSVATVPMGLVFESARGIELLGLDMQVSWIGAPVEDRLAEFPVITSAVLVAEENQVRFTCTSTAGLTGCILVWDYSLRAWYVWSYWSSTPFVDAAMIAGRYTALDRDGFVYVERAQGDANFSRDDSAFISPIAIEMHWISPSGPNAWHRIKAIQLLGTSLSNHDLTIKVARDYASGYEYTETFLAGSDVTAIGPRETVRLQPPTQKMQAIKLRVEVSTPTSPGTYPVGSGKGLQLEAIALEVQRKGGPAKLSAGRQG